MPQMIRLAHTPVGEPVPAGNRILASLARCDLRMLEPMEYVRLRTRYTLFEAGDAPRHLYFPASGLVSLVHVDERGAMPEIAQIGAEGIVGVSALLGAERARHRAVVQVAGAAYRVPLSSARTAFEQSRIFQGLALKFAEVLLAEVSQKVICKLRHTVEQQFCQRLLLYADRTRESVLELTHEQMADALGSRRQGITGAARKLQAREVIAYSRGHISVLDRATLERYACECYGIVRDAYAELGGETAPAPSANAG
jgi:CRP-like cAMP-binding protein